MSGLTGKKNSTLVKEKVKESKLLVTGVKNVKFWYEASAGDTAIPFGSISAGSTPTDIANSGLINPDSSEILAANLALFHTNVEVHSSLNQKLMEGLSYIVKNSQITFTNGYVATEGEIFAVIYKNDTITGTNVVDAKPLTATGTLAATTVDFNVGESFKTNAYPNSQLGEVLVFVDGIVQYRNVANATAGPSADGNYEEVHAANGQGVIIRFNESYITDKPIIVISRNLIAERPDISMMQLIENLGGQLDSVLSTVAALAGVPLTDFQTAPNQVDLKAFGDAVIANRQNIASNTSRIVINEAKLDMQYCELHYETNTTFTSGLQDRVWSAPTLGQGPSNGISLGADNTAPITFTKKGAYLVTIGMRAVTDVWQKWGMRSNDNATIVGECNFHGGGTVNQGISFIVEINDVAQPYKFFTVCAGVVTIVTPITPAGNIGTTNRTITATITELKRF